MNISIRNLDDAAGLKIKQQAKKNGMSMESYIRHYLETLAALEDIKMLDLKYSNLVKEVATVINNNTNEIKNIYELLNVINTKIGAINSTGN